MIAGTLELQLFANMARLSKDMNDAKTMVGSSMKSIEGAVSAAKFALGSLGVGIGIGGLIAIAKASIDAADHLHDLSKSTKIAVEDLAGLKLLAQQTGTDLDGMAKGMNKLSVAIGKDPAAFKALGITAKDEIGQFKQLADLLNLLPDINQRNAVAQKAMGKSWAELAPAFSEGSVGIQAAIDKGKALSGMTKQMAKDADEFKDKMAELNTTLGAGMTKAIGPLLPAFHDIASAMAEAAKEGGLLLAVWVGMGGAIQLLALEVRKLIGLPMTEIAALTKDAEELDKALKAMSSSVNPGVRARYEEQLGVTKARLELLKREEAMARAKPEASKPEIDKAAAAAAAARAKAFINEGKEGDSFYRSTLKSLKEKLLLDTELTEVAKLQLAINALTAKQRADLSPKEEEHLKNVAKEVELLKKRKEAREQEGKNEEALIKLREEGAVMEAEAEKKKGDALIAGYEQLRQMEFEITLIGKTTQEREVAIKMRELENSAMDKTSESYLLLRERMKGAIISKEQAEEAKTRSVGLWQSFESAGHQAFLSLFDTSKSVLERIRDMLKTHLIELLYQMTVKPFIIQIATSFSGAGVAQAAFGSGGGGLFGGGGFNPLSMLSNGASSLFGASNFGAALAGDAFMPAMLGAEGVGAASFSSMAGGAMAGIGAAIPWVGAALFAANALGLFGESGGPKPSELGILRQPTGEFYVSQNNVPGGEANLPLYNTLNAILNDPKKFDPEKLAGLTGYMIGGAGESAEQMFQKLTLALAPAAAAAEQAAKAADELKLRVAGLKDSILEAQDPLGFWQGQLAATAKELGTSRTSMEQWRIDFLWSLEQGIGAEAIDKWQKLGNAIAHVSDLTDKQRQADEQLAAEKQRQADQGRAFSESLNARAGVAQSLSQLVTGLSTSGYLSPLDQLSNARRNFQDTATRARLGDTDAALRLGDSANQYLSSGRSVFASGVMFQDIFREVNSSISDAATVNQRNLNVLLAETPAAIQAGFADQIRALQEGFTSVVDAVNRLSSGVRQAVAA